MMVPVEVRMRNNQAKGVLSRGSQLGIDSGMAGPSYANIWEAREQT